MPGELRTDEARRFLDGLAEFGDPRPILVMTGGDVLRRKDLFPLLEYARDCGLTATLAPAVSEALTEEMLTRFVEAGLKTISISLDGEGSVHDGIRGFLGHWALTCAAIRTAVRCGLRVQVNTCVMRDNVAQLPALFARARELGAAAWEVFFLIQTGRGAGVEDITPEESEVCMHFLYDAACRGMVVRTVEAPFFRRVVLQREAGIAPPTSPLYREWSAQLAGMAPTGQRAAQTAGTRDGKGIVFVAYDGTIQPGGFLPLPCGNVRVDPVATVYRRHPLFLALRDTRRFRGRCGMCGYRELCGGSRARAFATFGDPLAEDPACAYIPAGA